MKNIMLASCFTFCSMLLFGIGFGQDELSNERIGPWTIFFVEGYSISNREDTPGQAILISFDCKDDQLNSHISSPDYLMFEDASTVEILYRTDNTGIETLQWELDSESDYLVVSESYLDTWINHLADARELTVQVTAGGYEYTHSFDVSDTTEALATLTCRYY